MGIKLKVSLVREKFFILTLSMEIAILIKTRQHPSILPDLKLQEVTMFNVKKLLVPTDLSDHAREVTQYASEFAQKNPAEVILLTVYTPSDALESNIHPAAEIALRYIEDQAKQNNQTVKEFLEADIIKQLNQISQDFFQNQAKIMVTPGKPFVEICRIAKEEHIDLIIMGTHGRTGLGHILIGSVAENVVRKSPCPVLVVKPEALSFEML